MNGTAEAAVAGTRRRANSDGERQRLRKAYPDYMRVPWRSKVAVALAAGPSVALVIYAAIALDISFARFGAGFDRLGVFLGLMLRPSPQGQFAVLAGALLETLAIAFLGTLLAAALALPLGLAAARNVLPAAAIRFGVRRSLDGIRAVDTLIWALVWINAVGLGPFAGVLAIACADLGSFGKLFADAMENASRKAYDGITASGGGFMQRIRFGILPEVFPVLISQVLYAFEANARSATIIGAVGAGGIGLYLKESIDELRWERVSFIILLILTTVAALDFLSSRLRLSMSGSAPRCN